MRFRTFLCLVAIATGVTVTTSQATAGPNHAVQCNPRTSDVGSVGYGRFGIHNESTTRPVLLHCGGAKGWNAFWTSVVATVFDRSPFDDVRCTVFLTAADGGIIFSTSMSSAGFGSGAMTLATALPSPGGFIEMECSLPARDPSNGVSHLATYETP